MALFLFPPLGLHFSLSCSEDLHQNYSVFTGESNSQMEIIGRNLVGPSKVRALPLVFAEELKCPVFAWATNSQEVLLLNTGSDTVVFIHLV